ncbi:MAG: hypothetical protein Q4D55_11920, partial [Eubacteriales bacterium]|nr:hypothetical protein [Eubacteriales bacterium]
MTLKTDRLQRKHSAFFLSFLVMTLISVITVCVGCYRQRQINLESARGFTDIEKNKLQYAIDSRLLNTQILKALVMSHQGEVTGFEEIAALLYTEGSAVRS